MKRSNRHGRRASALGALVAALLAIALVSACSSSSSSNGGASGSGSGSGSASSSPAPLPDYGTVVTSPVPTTGDPLAANAGSSIPYLFTVYGGLFDPTIDGKLTPDLALSYAYSNDNKTLTIQLRPNVKFQDGTPFNADAVVFSFKRASVPPSPMVSYFAGVTSMVSSGDTTVVLTSSSPNTTLMSGIAAAGANFIGSPTAFQQMGADKFALNPVGAGPFKLTSYTPTVSFVTEAWPGYWDAAHRYLKGVTFQAISTDLNVGLQDLKSGAIDYLVGNGALVAPSVFAAAAADPNLKIVKGAFNNFTMFVNATSAPFNNQDARSALDYCMDRDSLARNITDGNAQASYTFGSGPGQLYYPGDDAAKKLMPYQFDVTKGSAIVKQLGGLSFTITSQTDPQRQIMIEAIGSQLEKCGMKVQYNFTNSTAVGAANNAGQYQIIIQQAGGLPNPIFTVAQYSQKGAVRAKFSVDSPQVDDLLTQIVATSDETAIQKSWNQIWQTQNTLGINIPILAAPNQGMTSKCLQAAVPYQSSAFFNKAYFSCKV